MKNLRITLAFLLLANISINAYAVESEYIPSSKILTIPTVKIGDGFVYDAKLKLNGAGSFDIVGYSETPPTSGNVDTKCTEDKITLEKYKQITDEMTLEQVNSVIGCAGKLNTVEGTSDEYYYKWEADSLPRIDVTFKNNIVVSKDFYSES